jgi:hypothetical protein
MEDSLSLHRCPFSNCTVRRRILLYSRVLRRLGAQERDILHRRIAAFGGTLETLKHVTVGLH